MIKCFAEWGWTAEMRSWAVFQLLTSLRSIFSTDPEISINFIAFPIRNIIYRVFQYF